MSHAQYKRIVDELGITRAAIARFIGISARTAHRYANGTSDIPPAYVLLLRAMLALNAKPVIPKWNKDQN
jgi:transcriptional regulator with XRE-family HTH domain